MKKQIMLIIIGLISIVPLYVLSVWEAEEQNARNSFSYISDNFGVVWNTGSEDPPIARPPGGSWRIEYGYILYDVLRSESANPYIAFVAENHRLLHDHPIDPSVISTVKILDRGNILTDLIAKYTAANTSEEKEQFHYDIHCYLIELTSGLDAYQDADVAVFGRDRDLEREQQIIGSIYLNEICKERHIYPPSYYNPEVEALIRQEAEERALLQDERYRELCSMRAYYADLTAYRDIFWEEWNVLAVKTTRERFVKWGFLPVYSEEEAGSSRKLLLTFVGTAAQIKSLDCLVEDTESFIVVMANPPANLSNDFINFQRDISTESVHHTKKLEFDEGEHYVFPRRYEFSVFLF